MIGTASVDVTLDRGGISRLVEDPMSQMAQALTRVGNQIVNAAKPKANVDTGLMRSRIEFVLDATARPPAGAVVARTNYSKYVHDGHHSYPGNPFLTDAARDVMG